MWQDVMLTKASNPVVRIVASEVFSTAVGPARTGAASVGRKIWIRSASSTPRHSHRSPASVSETEGEASSERVLLGRSVELSVAVCVAWPVGVTEGVAAPSKVAVAVEVVVPEAVGSAVCEIDKVSTDALTLRVCV